VVSIFKEECSMKAKSSLMLAMAAGGLFTTGAMAGEPNLTGDFLAGRVAGYVYVNAATGEVVKTTGASRFTELYWQNDDIAGSCNFFYGQDRPTRDTVATGRVKFGSMVVDWGDVAGGSFTDGYDVAYASNIGCDTLGSGVAGFNMVNVFLDDYDGEIDPGGAGATALIGFILEGIAGGDCTLGTALFAGWIYTVDLEGSGNEFTLDGQNLDSDGLHDFGIGYTFEQGQAEPKGIVGPFLVRPFSLGGLGDATGVVDAIDWFNQPDFTDYVGAFWFGGGDCAIPQPYASFLLNLYGTEGGGGGCDAIDYNEDGIIDFGDYLEFLNRFDAQDPSADLNGDSIIDFGDYLEFLNLFDACSGG
jgi:hypothetical protein